MTLSDIYAVLLWNYGPQGWWPIHAYDGSNSAKTGVKRGYHPSDYSFPRTPRERYEICLGAILTQNTAWTNVEKALANLHRTCNLDPAEITRFPEPALAQAIRPSGYFNVKARKIRAFTDFYLAVDKQCVPSRAALLSVWGIGPETADSMLLYAYRQPEMVVDAYTRRILAHLGYVSENCSSLDLKTYCCSGLPKDLVVCQEFHALIVEHAKRFYAKAPYRDPLLEEQRQACSASNSCERNRCPA